MAAEKVDSPHPIFTVLKLDFFKSIWTIGERVPGRREVRISDRYKGADIASIMVQSIPFPLSYSDCPLGFPGRPKKRLMKFILRINLEPSGTNS
jgi:hypothetical protein